MKIFELATKLKAIYDEHGDIEVFFTDPNSDQGPFQVSQVTQCKAEKNEYPKDYNMPAGYKFVELTN
jgi:hypothetical protein